ncbi:MAG: heme biosynthesis protein HemY [Actinobacteria bacterium]|nr:heme biosynthesis protein HemY [Actinomycetota bacterium]
MGDEELDSDSTAEPAPDSKRFTKLPERVRLEDTVATQDARVARDPENGRDTDRDFMFRHLS